MDNALNDRWSVFLSAAGAHVEDGVVDHFGRPDAELDHARQGAIVCDLSSYGLIAFEGADAATFLHGQLSNDVLGLPADRCQLATYNTPKGRVLATMLLWHSAEGFLAQVPATLTEPLRKRVSMFILRSKVRAAVASERYVRIGVAGPEAAQILSAAGLALPPDAFALASGQQWADGTGIVNYLMHLPGQRFELLVADVNTATALWTALRNAGAMPAGTAPWRWLTVRSGVAEIVTETQDQFVAQMLNLELVGAISFTKGCYPGQEIVARTQYRGEIKRRSFLAHVDSDTAPAPASAIYAADHPDQAIGAVVMAAPAPSGGFDALVCVHVDLARQGKLHLGRPDGAHLHLLELP